MTSPLDIYEIFLVTVEEMNFTRAAQRLYITQQSLSGRIQHLEELHNVTLFERKPALKLTAAGERMVFFAKQLLRERDSLQQDLADIDPASSAILHLGMSQQRSLVFLKGIWQRYAALYPNISVRVRENLTMALLDELISRRLDMSISVNIGSISTIEKTILALEYPCCIVNRSLLEKYMPEAGTQVPEAGECISEAAAGTGKERYYGLEPGREELAVQVTDRKLYLSALRGIPLTMLPEGANMRIPIIRQFSEAGVAPRIILETLETDLLIETAVNGQALTVLSPMVIYHYLQKGQQFPEDCEIFTLDRITPVEVSLIERAGGRKPEYMRTLKEIIVDEFRKYRVEVGRG